MPSWKKLQEIGAEVAKNLPGVWDLSEPPPFWMAILTRSDASVRILIDDHFHIVVNVSTDGQPLSPMGQLNQHPSTLLQFRTRHRDPKKIASLLAQKLHLNP